MKKTRFLIALMLILALVVSCLQVVSVPALAKSDYVAFSITNGNQYYHLIKNIFSFENRKSETFERKYNVYNPTDHDVWVQFEVIDLATWGPTAKSGEILVAAGGSTEISTGNITVDGSGKITCSTQAGNVTQIAVTAATLRVNILGSAGPTKFDNQLAEGEKIYFEPLDQAELSWYNNGTTTDATLYSSSSNAAFETRLPEVGKYIGWKISGATKCYHIMNETFSFETDRAGTTFVRSYDIYNLSDSEIHVMVELDGSWKEYAMGTQVTIPAGGHEEVSTKNIVVDADGKILDYNGANPIPLTNARIRFNIGHTSAYDGYENTDCYIVAKDEREIAWLQDNEPSGSLMGATIERVKKADLENDFPELAEFIGWKLSGATQYYHMINGTFSFETDRADSTFVRTYDVYNLSDREIYVQAELDGSWKEYAIGTRVTIPAGGHDAVSTKNIVVDADGKILDNNGANPIPLTSARIRFNIGHTSSFGDFADADCYILPRDEEELAWLQDNEPAGNLGATVKKIKMSDIGGNGGLLMKQTIDFSDPNLMISGRYTENADGSRTIGFEPYTELNFTGTSVSVNGSGSCYLEIDGVPYKVNGQYKCIALSSNKGLAENLPEGNHCVRLYAFSQRCNYTIKEFYIDLNAQTLPPEYNKTIEFIGSSSLVAYTDARDPHEEYDTNTSYMISFAYQTGKMLQNDGFRFNTVAYGGSGVVYHSSANGASADGDKDYLTMQDRYKLVHEYLGGKGNPEPTPVAAWDHSKYVPDYIALYLGANDLGQGLDVFKTNYKGFIDQLLGYYPDAVIIAMAPYNSNESYAKALESVVNEYHSMQVRYVNTLNWGVSASPTDGMHAVAADHVVLAQKLYPELQKICLTDTFEFDSKNLALENSLTFRFKGFLHDKTPADDAYMEFKIGDVRTENIPLSKATTDEKGRYVFNCHVNVLELDEKIEPIFHDGEKTVERQNPVSVTDYLEQVLANHKGGTAEDIKNVNIVNAISNYAHYAQIALDETHEAYTVGADGKYHGTAARTAITQKTVDQLLDYKAVKNVAGEFTDVTATSRSLALYDKTAIIVYITPANSSYIPDVKVTDKFGENADFTCEKQADGRYMVVISGIAAHMLGSGYTVDIDNGKLTYTNLSALSYAYSILLSSNSEASKNAVSALYDYFVAADNFKK